MKANLRLVCLLLLCSMLLCVGCADRSSGGSMDVSRLHLPEKSDIVKIKIENARTFEKTDVTDAATITQIYDALNGIELSYTGNSSKGIYNTEFSLTFYGEEDRVLGYPICFYPEAQDRCEYLPSYTEYGYWNVFEMSGASAIYDIVYDIVEELPLA